MIDFLAQATQEDPRYLFQAVDFQNDMYNPDGRPLDGQKGLGLMPPGYDLLTMFSVVTHMTPQDTRSTLTALRQHAAADAVLIFSAFIDEDQTEDFVDTNPKHRLLYAYYRRDFLEAIVSETGWRIERFSDRIRGLVQSHYICRPA